MIDGNILSWYAARQLVRLTLIVIGAIAAAIAVMVLIMMFLMSGAQAQTPPRRPQLTGDIVKDTRANLGLNKKIGTDSAGTACDFNLFAAIQADNVIQSIQGCVNAQVSDTGSLFLPDVQAALDSATAYGDQPGVACLKPALSIVQAAVGTPAVPPDPGNPAAVPPVPATPGVAARMPGPILIFQKFREFELSGGPAACKTWVSSTISGANPLTQ